MKRGMARESWRGLLEREDGGSGSHIASGPIWVPHGPSGPRLEAGDLVWRSAGTSNIVCRYPTGRILEQFVQLEKAEDERIHGFAAKWGMLAVDRDPLGTAVLEKPGITPRPQDIVFAITNDWVDGCFRESVQLWRELAGKARAILSIAACLHDKKPSDPKDWLLLHPEYFANPPVPHAHDPLLDWARIQGLLVAWLDEGDVRPRLYVPPTATVVITLNGRGLLGTVAVQLLLATGCAQGFAICSGCGIPYVPAKRPSTGTRHYCGKCIDGKVSQRDAARDTATRRATTLQLHEAGLAIEDIASRVGSTSKTVRGWIKGKTRQSTAKRQRPGRGN